MKIFKDKTFLWIALLFILGSALFTFGALELFKDKTITITKITHPNTYKELYNLIKSKNYDYNTAETSKGATTDQVTNNEYSTTNTQVAGVDEADIVKTDGNYIYSIKDNYIYIVKVDKDNMELVSKIKGDTDSSNYIEMYINNNKLIVIKNEYSNIYKKMDAGVAYDMPEFFGYRNSKVSIVVFDITNKDKPVKLNELSQSGSYLSSRMVGDYVYVLTNYYVYGNIEVNDEKTYVPTLTTDKERTIDVKDILIAPNPTTSSYLTITGTNINESSKFTSSKAVFGASSNIYADLDSIYVAGYNGKTVNNTYVSSTSLVKFSMNNGAIKLDATGEVKGTVLNQFSMDENNGYFRIVTTSDEYSYTQDKDTTSVSTNTNSTKNNLYVLDSNLNVVGKIEELAKGERIYSVRFDKDIAYFVTFKQVDPLFVADLSNPKNPTIKSELKIPGFSEYLHVYNDKYLFGLGKSADTEGKVTGLKISMFNIENKLDVTEVYNTKVGDSYSWSEASYNHKSILVSNTKNIVAFPIDDYFVVYKFEEEKGFTAIGKIKFSTNNDYYYFGSIRGLYINDYLYAINQAQIKTFDLNTLQAGKSIDLE